jgi:hypothetical protein
MCGRRVHNEKYTELADAVEYQNVVSSIFEGAKSNAVVWWGTKLIISSNYEPSTVELVSVS